MKRSKMSITIILIMLFIILSICVSTNILNGFDTFFYNQTVTYMSFLLTTIMKGISYLGNAVCVVVICIIMILNPKTRWKYGAITSLGVILSFGINTILKVLFGRERPDILKLVNENSYSFPSSHAMINITLYSLLGIFIYKNIKNKNKRFILLSICFIMPIMIGISRVYLGVHYITDVVAGWIAGLVVALIVYEFTKKV